MADGLDRDYDLVAGDTQPVEFTIEDKNSTADPKAPFPFVGDETVTFRYCLRDSTIVGGTLTLAVVSAPQGVWQGSFPASLETDVTKDGHIDGEIRIVDAGGVRYSTPDLISLKVRAPKKVA